MNPPLPPKPSAGSQGQAQSPGAQAQSPGAQAQSPGAEAQSLALPEFTQVLPDHELARLLNSIHVLRGFVVTLSQQQLDAQRAQVDALLAQVDSFYQQLDLLQQQKLSTNSQLDALNQLVKTWETVQDDMYRSLKPYSLHNLSVQLASLIEDCKKLTESQSSSFVSHIGQHDEQSIQSFISSYRSQRKLYHLRVEKQHRLNEQRVGGLI